MDVIITADKPIAPRQTEIGGAVYIEDVRGRFVPEAMYHAAAQVKMEPAIVELNGRPGMMDATGKWVPIALVKPANVLEDEIVRKCIAFALDASASLSRLLGHTKFDLGSYDALLEQEYGVTKRGEKGNATYYSYDGLYRVQVQVATLIDFGPELHIAKSLVDECINDWSADSRVELQALVTRAFNVDQEGTLNRSEIYRLLRYEMSDPRWKRAMDAIRDAMRPIGSKEYIRFGRRADIKAKWETISLDFARA